MATFLTILLVIDVLVLMILVVGLQHGSEGGGLGSAFGSGNSTGFFGASGGVSFIVRATWIVGTLFFAISLTLAWVKTREHFGVGREVNNLLMENLEVTPVPGDVPTAIASPVATVSPAPAAP